MTSPSCPTRRSAGSGGAAGARSRRRSPRARSGRGTRGTSRPRPPARRGSRCPTSSSRSSAPKIGAPVRTASATASDGRALTDPLVAEDELGDVDAVAHLGDVARPRGWRPGRATTSRSRSWVIGRAGRTPCCSKAMAAASTAPIQIGRYRSPCVSLSSRIGWLPGSSTRTPTTRSSCTVRLPRLRARARAGAGGRIVAGSAGRAIRRSCIDVHGTPESGAQEFPQARLQQRGVQLGRQRGELAQLLRRPGCGPPPTGPAGPARRAARPGRPRARRRCGRPAGAAARCRAGPARPRPGRPAGRRRVPAVGVGGEQAELHAVGQLCGLEARRPGRTARRSAAAPTVVPASPVEARRHRAPARRQPPAAARPGRARRGAP